MSGQELSRHFGVSRTAVWKAVEQLKKDGYVIEAVKNRGYLLHEEERDEVFNRTELESRLGKLTGKGMLYFYETIDSTNVEAKRLAEKGAPSGTTVVSDHQTSGRGRRGRTWESPKGSNVYFTILLRPQIPPAKASMLTLVMALAVAEGISRTCTGETLPGIKWPNDIVLEGRKAAGILTEMSLSVEQDCIQYVVIGTGINVKSQHFAEEVADRAIALEDVYGPVNRSTLLANILEAFDEYYQQFLREENLSLLRDKYHCLLVNMDRKVRVLDPRGEYDGIARGIRDTGELMVEREDGSLVDVYAGEVSVRGIYGYV